MSLITAADYFAFCSEEPEGFDAHSARASELVKALCGRNFPADETALSPAVLKAVKQAVCAVVSFILSGGLDGFSSGSVGSVRFEKEAGTLPREVYLYLAPTGLLYTGM